MAIQPKLLRSLQEREIQPLGATKPVPVDVRVLAATNQDLGQKVLDGEFRDDLLDRLNEFVIELPPLCQKLDDLEILVDKTLQLHNLGLDEGQRIRGIEQAVFDVMRKHTWPGNVRELENVVKAAAAYAVRSHGGVIAKEQVAGQIAVSLASPKHVEKEMSELLQAWRAYQSDAKNQALLTRVGEAVEGLLDETNGVKSRAAELAGISRPTLYEILKTVNRTGNDNGGKKASQSPSTCQDSDPSAQDEDK